MSSWWCTRWTSETCRVFLQLLINHSESFEVFAEVHPEDSVLLRHDAASVGNLMHTFRQSICLRTYSVTSGQSAWKGTELSADPCIIYVRARTESRVSRGQTPYELVQQELGSGKNENGRWHFNRTPYSQCTCPPSVDGSVWCEIWRPHSSVRKYFFSVIHVLGLPWR